MCVYNRVVRVSSLLNQTRALLIAFEDPGGGGSGGAVAVGEDVAVGKDVAVGEGSPVAVEADAAVVDWLTSSGAF